MALGGAEDQRFFALVYLFHEQLDAMRFTGFDFDDPVEVRFRIALSALDFALHHKIIRRVDVIVERGSNLLGRRCPMPE